MNTLDFKNDLKKALVLSGMSQSRLAMVCGLSQGTISKILRGKKEIWLSTAILLWPYAYGIPFPRPASPSTPTEPEEVSNAE
ncbi:helix-turn-helix transcriptional regulator [uncultured Bilophila sp.]|mgnify:CR=1 FL=1|uniref:helix-turn-helix domain-containing protein n=1 Tax=uncultured Bilophila sp. TaxID=529385 RepID=UPI0027378F07|nr:helix-turn-helix transcriptional regulator [uncultured Bilophila sp.]